MKIRLTKLQLCDWLAIGLIGSKWTRRKVSRLCAYSYQWLSQMVEQLTCAVGVNDELVGSALNQSVEICLEYIEIKAP